MDSNSERSEAIPVPVVNNCRSRASRRQPTSLPEDHVSRVTASLGLGEKACSEMAPWPKLFSRAKYSDCPNRVAANSRLNNQNEVSLRVHSKPSHSSPLHL